jgi:hypothetical protein
MRFRDVACTTGRKACRIVMLHQRDVEKALALINPAESQPSVAIFRPKNLRPARDEMWEMKQAVIARDGLTTCFWCRQPFTSEADATLEHINPIFSGGVHDLRNCTLACAACNSRNQPRVLIDDNDARRAAKAAQKEANKLVNGYAPCPPEYLTVFSTIARTLAGKPMTYANASFYLKGYRRQHRLEPPSAEEKHQFKAHYNRWVTQS